MKYSISITQSHRPANGEICNKSYLAHRPWSAVTEPAGCASPKEQTINQDQFTLSLQTACLIQQNQLLKRQNAMLLEILDGMESVGDRLWRVERRLATQSVDLAGTRKRAAKKRRPAHEQSVARTRSDK
ncbi:hypothetical protein [Acidovorax sp. GW101-3H11]|uniref:hypothetical protein n=1 Tax=Acidovorax sp. GW101-3H11 TaxID=1813946 RepID=UPI000B1598BE|nr:hypothetical protein [Acidovorax sp. GW101-3H11]